MTEERGIMRQAESQPNLTPDCKTSAGDWANEGGMVFQLRYSVFFEKLIPALHYF